MIARAMETIGARHHARSMPQHGFGTKVVRVRCNRGAWTNKHVAGAKRHHELAAHLSVKYWSFGIYCFAGF